MSPDQKRLWGVVAALLAVAIALLLAGRAQERLAPRPVAAWVAIEPEGPPVAISGPVQLDAGRPFLLRAVLEAETWSGGRIYWTEAEALEIAGVEIPADAIRRFPGESSRLLWFTVEGVRPYLEVGAADPASVFEFREVFRPDWPRAWTVPGVVAPSAAAANDAVHPFGTQRYHLRIELFGPESDIVPRHKIDSPGASALPGGAATFPTVTASLPGALAAPSSVFGLTQIERQPQSPTAAAGLRLAEWTDDRIAFSRVSLLRETLDRIGTTWDDLEWSPVELDGTVGWGAPGDLVRAGARVVHLFRDRGVAGRLDDDDLSFDFDRGAVVRRLGDIYTGDGLVELARLPAVTEPPAKEAN